MIGADDVVFGLIIVVSCYLTYKICRYGKKYIRDTIFYELEHDTELQQKVKERFGWK